MIETLARLFEHQRWADERVLRSLEAAEEAGPALKIYAHILGAEDVWLARLLGAPPTLAVWPLLDLGECAALSAALGERYRQFVRTLPPEGLRREVGYTNSAGTRFATRVEDILLQVATHGCYHRGQVALLLRQGERTPAATDYITFVREGAAVEGGIGGGGTNP